MVDKNDPVLVFTTFDRCDACGAQAYALASHDDHPGELLFCGHHLREHGPRLMDEEWTIVGDVVGLEEYEPA